MELLSWRQWNHTWFSWREWHNSICPLGRNLVALLWKDGDREELTVRRPPRNLAQADSGELRPHPSHATCWKQESPGSYLHSSCLPGAHCALLHLSFQLQFGKHTGRIFQKTVTCVYVEWCHYWRRGYFRLHYVLSKFGHWPSVTLITLSWCFNIVRATLAPVWILHYWYILCLEQCTSGSTLCDCAHLSQSHLTLLADINLIVNESPRGLCHRGVANHAPSSFLIFE